MSIISSTSLKKRKTAPRWSIKTLGSKKSFNEDLLEIPDNIPFVSIDTIPISSPPLLGSHPGIETSGRILFELNYSSKEVMAMACDSKVNCTCTYACPRHGKCCECVTYHRVSQCGSELLSFCSFRIINSKKKPARKATQPVVAGLCP